MEINIGFSDVAHMVAEVYQTGPKNMEEIALKAVLLKYIPWDFLLLDALPTII